MLNRCKQSDSVDVITHITGGTPPYNFLWSTGDTSRNFENLPYSQNPFFNCNRHEQLHKYFSIIHPRYRADDFFDSD